MHYSMPSAFIEAENGDLMPFPNLDEGVRNFQIMLRGFNEEGQHLEFGYANITYVDFSKTIKGENFNLSDTARHYGLHFPKEKKKILFIDKLAIDKPFRGQGYGSDYLSRMLLLFQTIQSIDKIVLCPYPFELNGGIRILKKPAFGDLMEEFYSSYYLSQKERLETFYGQFGFVSHKTPTADVQDVMILPTYKTLTKEKDFLTSLYHAKPSEELFYMFASTKQNGQTEYEVHDLESCKKIFSKED